MTISSRNDIFTQFAGMDCVVTGGAGAIGSNLVRALRHSGARVTVLDNLSSGHADNLADLPDVRLVRGDVADPVAVDDAFGSNPAYVFHLAAQFANQNSVEHPLTDLRTNAGGTLELLERARRTPSVRGFVYASTSCVLGGQGGTLSETSPVHPDTPYAVSKLAGEYYVGMYNSLHGTPTVVVRYFNVFGPGERPGRYRNVLPNFVHRALRGEPLSITGTGEETREFVFVEDAVQGTLRAALTEEAHGRCFHIGSGRVLTIRELAEKVQAATGSLSAIEFQPKRHWDAVPHRCTDFTRARKILGYAPQVEFEDGLARTVSWMRRMIGSK